MRDLLITLIVFGCLPFALKKPAIGILLWSWLGYMNPHRLSYGFAYDFPFAQIVAIVMIISVVITKEPRSVPVTPLTITWWIFIVWMGVTSLFAVFPESAQPQYIKVLKIQLIVFFTLMFMGTKERINMLLWVIVGSLGFFGVKGGIFTVLSGGSFTVWGPSGSYIEDNNALATTLLMVIPLMQYLRMQAENKWVRHALLASMILCAFSAVGSYSRGAFLAGFSMAAFMWIKGERKFITAMVMVLVIPLLLMFMPDRWHQRMDTIETYEEDASAMGRINAWYYAFNAANDRLTGMGFESWSAETFAQYAPVPEDVHAAHSIYFSVLADHGWIGLLLYISIYIMAWRCCTWTIRNTKGIDELIWASNLARMVQICFVAYATGGAFLSLSYFDFPWHIVSICVLLRELVKRHLAGVEGDSTSEVTALSLTPEKKSWY